MYFVFAMAPAEFVVDARPVVGSRAVSAIRAPTSVGLLFSMLAAAGPRTWLYKKARTLADLR